MMRVRWMLEPWLYTTSVMSSCGRGHEGPILWVLSVTFSCCALSARRHGAWLFDVVVLRRGRKIYGEPVLRGAIQGLVLYYMVL